MAKKIAKKATGVGKGISSKRGSDSGKAPAGKALKGLKKGLNKKAKLAKYEF